MQVFNTLKLPRHESCRIKPDRITGVDFQGGQTGHNLHSSFICQEKMDTPVTFERVFQAVEDTIVAMLMQAQTQSAPMTAYRDSIAPDGIL